MSSRPALVTVVAVIVYINALVSIVGGVILLVAATTPEVQGSTGGAGLAIGTGIITMLLGLITLFVARGLFSGSNLSRGIIAVIQLFSAANALFNLLRGDMTVGVVNLVLALIVLGILYSRRANGFFRQ